MSNTNRPAAHIRHKGIMIDASWNKDGTVDYYVVQGSRGRFYGLDIAKEIAEGIARRKAA
jgi:hypothetical protein